MLALVQTTVAATQRDAFGRAFVVVGIVTVVAFLVIGFGGMQITAVHAIATTRFSAAAQAGIIVFEITIIASLKPVFALSDITALYTVAASSRCAGV